MKVKDIMTKDVIYAEVPGTSASALELILKHNVSGLPVVKKGTKQLVGVVTRDDFNRKPEEGQLALLMTRNVVTISPDADIKEAIEIFLREEFKRLPVVEDGELVGILTISDIIWKYIATRKFDESIEKYMRTSLAAIWEGTPLKVSLEIMRLSNSRALPVLNDEGKLVGIVADTDLLKELEITESTEKSELFGGTEGDKWGWDSKNVIYITKKKLELPDKPVKEVMVKKVITATKKTSVSEVAKK
ncbi:MAG: inosine-5-monophosphate dehydrogenase, partial [Candidatus Hydrothermarchaeota archaeon]